MRIKLSYESRVPHQLGLQVEKYMGARSATFAA
jgi:hypothetical protein